MRQSMRQKERRHYLIMTACNIRIQADEAVLKIVGGGELIGRVSHSPGLKSLSNMALRPT